MDAIGQRLVAVRHHRGLSQAALARIVGVSKASVGHWEHGRAQLNTKRLFELAAALNCRPKDLLSPVEAPLRNSRRGGDHGQSPSRCPPNYRDSALD